jgi:hypothetical protein
MMSASYPYLPHRIRLLLSLMQDLIEIVKTVDAKMLFPIHTEHPEMYLRVTRNMTVLEEANSYHKW